MYVAYRDVKIYATFQDPGMLGCAQERDCRVESVPVNKAAPEKMVDLESITACPYGHG